MLPCQITKVRIGIDFSSISKSWASQCHLFVADGHCFLCMSRHLIQHYHGYSNTTSDILTEVLFQDTVLCKNWVQYHVKQFKPEKWLKVHNTCLPTADKWVALNDMHRCLTLVEEMIIHYHPEIRNYGLPYIGHYISFLGRLLHVPKMDYRNTLHGSWNCGAWVTDWCPFMSHR